MKGELGSPSLARAQLPVPPLPTLLGTRLSLCQALRRTKQQMWRQEPSPSPIPGLIHPGKEACCC